MISTPPQENEPGTTEPAEADTETPPTTPPPARRVPRLVALGLAGTVVGALVAVVRSPEPTVQVVESGASEVELTPDDGSALSWGAVVGNPRDEAAIDTWIDVEILDREGEVVETRGATVAVIRPGETVGMGGWIDDVPDGVDVRVKVDRTASWRSADDGQLGEIRVEDVEVAFSHDNAPIVMFTVPTSDVLPMTYGDAEIVLRDERGRIIGGLRGIIREEAGAGDSISSYVLAPFSVPDLARVDVYGQPPYHFLG